MNDAESGYRGFSPASCPFGGYPEWGVDAMGMDTNGYPSDVGSVPPMIRGLAGADGRWSRPRRTTATGGPIPHAVFLALPYPPTVRSGTTWPA